MFSVKLFLTGGLCECWVTHCMMAALSKNWMAFSQNWESM